MTAIILQNRLILKTKRVIFHKAINCKFEAVFDATVRQKALLVNVGAKFENFSPLTQTLLRNPLTTRKNRSSETQFQ